MDAQRAERGNGQEAGAAGRGGLILSLVLILAIMVAEIIGGLLSGSLVLLADAGHMLATGSAIGIALFASWAESKPPSIERTFGYHRVEVVGAMLSSLALWLVAAWVLFESISRLRDQDGLEVEGGVMLVIGAIGLGINVLAALILMRASRRSVNASNAFRHLVADLLASVAVVVAALLVLLNDWIAADAIFSIGVAALTAASSWRLILQVFHTLLEGTPEHIDLYQLCADIEDEPGVTVIYDVHAWSISDYYDVFTAHIIIEPEYLGRTEELLSRMRRLVYDKHGIQNMTVQLEVDASESRENAHLGHLEARSRHDR